MINNNYLNTYFNIDAIDNDINDSSTNSIRYLNNNVTNNVTNNETINLLNNIIQHPFIDELSVFSNNIRYKKYSKINIIFYRINYSCEIPFIEYYFENLDNFLFVDNSNYKNFNKLNSDLYNYLNGFSTLTGLNIIEGVIEDNEIYIIVKNKITNKTYNYNYDNWLTIYDIVVNKHLFGTYIYTYN